MCWSDPECAETSAPDHVGDNLDHHVGEVDGDDGEVGNRTLGLNRKY